MDWSAWVNQVILPIAATVIVPLAVVWIKGKLEKAGIAKDDAAKRALEGALQAAAALVMSGRRTLPEAATYVKEGVPDAQKRLGVSDARIPQIIEARTVMSEDQKTALLNQQPQGAKP
jgi:hypothetical protein